MREELRERWQTALERLQAAWEELPPERQRLLKRWGGPVVAALLLLLVATPLVAQRVRVRRELEAAQARAAEMRRLEVEIRRLGLHRRQVAEPDELPQTSLLKLVDRVARKLEIAGNVQSIQPVKRHRGRRREEVAAEDAVEVQLKEMVLDEFVRFLYQLELVAGTRIRRLEVHKDLKDPTKLSVALVVAR